MIVLVKEMNGMSGASKKKHIKAGKWVVGALESLCGEQHKLGRIQYGVEDRSSMRHTIAALIELDVVFGLTEKSKGTSSTKKRKQRNDSKKTSSSSSKSSKSSKSGVKKKRTK